MLTKGDLPPKGSFEFYRVKTIINKKRNEIIGFLEYYIGYPNSNTLWIGTFYLKKEQQHKGYGKEVVQSLVDYLSKVHFQELL